MQCTLSSADSVKLNATLSEGFCASTLISLFNACFAMPPYNTVLVGNASEPIYLPADEDVTEYLCLSSSNASFHYNQQSAKPCVNKIAWFGYLNKSAHQNELSSLPEGNKIFFTRDYFASALHEISHWCIAGKSRRQRIDYGYWYAPDGRNLEQQLEFEKVEIKPQAIEWAFSLACNKPFRVSNDNLALSEHDSSKFERAVFTQLNDYIERGFGLRAQQFLDCLQAHYGTSLSASMNELLQQKRYSSAHALSNAI